MSDTLINMMINQCTQRCIEMRLFLWSHNSILNRNKNQDETRVTTDFIMSTQKRQADVVHVRFWCHKQVSGGCVKHVKMHVTQEIMRVRDSITLHVYNYNPDRKVFGRTCIKMRHVFMKQEIILLRIKQYVDLSSFSCVVCINVPAFNDTFTCSQHAIAKQYCYANFNLLHTEIQ